MKHCFLMLFAGLLLAGSAHAQLRFTRADIEPTLTDRSMTIFSTQVLSGVTFNLGGSGGGQVYDFTGFGYEQSQYQSVYILPDATPYAMDYPTATHSQIIGTVDPAYSYSRLDDNGYYDLGFATEISGAPYILKYDPEQPSVKFPAQLGSSWNYNGNEIMPMEGFYQKTEMQIDIVSEGILMTTQGSWPALCIRNNSRFTNRIVFAGTVISEVVTSSVNYMFMTKNGVSASISVDTLDAASWTPHITTATVSFDETTNTAQELKAPEFFGIVSVYPHPVADGSTLVTWKTEGRAVLTLHDNCGRELRRITSDAAPGLLHQTRVTVQGLPAGMYFLRLAEGASVSQKPLLILR